MKGILKYIFTEAFNYRRFEEGEVEFSKSTIDSPHVQNVIKFISSATGESAEEIETRIVTEIKQHEERAPLAPRILKTMAQNAAETEAFFELCKVDKSPPGAPRFSKLIFTDLRVSIQAEYQSNFYPLRSFIDKRAVYDPDHKFNDHELDFDSPNITTAAASPNGTFEFNVRFMQKLIDYAFLKQVKPKGSKYISNGGEIPDEYCYIEFLILHEYLHYTEGDFLYMQILTNVDPTIINWVGDFRSNYLLVKSGYEQLPMGLFSSAVNYDRQDAYYEMYKIVEEEYNSLPYKMRFKVGDKVKLPDGSPAIIKEINGDDVVVERI